MTSTAPLPRSIALCVDDFGLHPGVNEAALRLAALGRATAVSCMTGAPAWQGGAAALRPLAPQQLDVGLHLDLTQHPVDRALQRSLPSWWARSAAHLVGRERLRRELDAQLDRFEAAMGQPPAHVDGHQHVHQFPVIRDVLLRTLEARYPPPLRPWLRSTRPPAGAMGKPWLLQRLGGAAFERLARAHGFACNRRLLGVYGFGGTAPGYQALLSQWLDAARDGDLLMCHAGLGSPEGDPIAAARRREYEVLAGDAFAALLARLHVQLVPLSRLARG
ncbi:ChbG/HpnK family deacetylase [Ramlibacter sp.]|uniref:ChbG/HpnK family deacetylase n=1 Tax=Ramlibacter sp. TaxID=1917967 RepID=UPI002D009923|nr:ChbG/HpnK family deacetylase [Ramlibacter sp.]HWI82010.1 ChbG/HpnK family deacetylase [Ramlibacter sp.]